MLTNQPISSNLNLQAHLTHNNDYIVKICKIMKNSCRFSFLVLFSKSNSIHNVIFSLIADFVKLSAL